MADEVPLESDTFWCADPSVVRLRACHVMAWTAGLAALTVAAPLSYAVSALGMALLVVGFIFVWFPETTSVIARRVGVGRGADLVMYLWIVLTLLFIVRLHLKLRELTEAMTQLARRIALNDAETD